MRPDAYNTSFMGQFVQPAGISGSYAEFAGAQFSRRANIAKYRYR